MENKLTTPSSGGRTKFIVGGLLILAAVIYLIISSTQASAHYFLTVDELKAKGEEMYGRNVRISGAVLGDTINYDPYTFTLEFAVANVPGTNREIDAQGGLSKVLYDAVNDPSRTRLNVIYTKGPKPDLLQHEAQAIMTGKMGEDGYFYADELLLKCPTKYEEIVAGQVEG
jgi:cytochrome c-type biogenesis protein CcmE